VAKVSQGATVTWKGPPGTTSSALSEVVSISVDGVSSDVVEVTSKSYQGRDKRFRSADGDYGTITVRCRGTNLMNTSYVTMTGALSIMAPSASFSSSRAILQSLAWNASVGELQEWTAVFKITE
jgi:hypothetical protein